MPSKRKVKWWHYSVTYGMPGYLPDSGSLYFGSTRGEMADMIRDNLKAYDMPAALFHDVRLQRIWGGIKRWGSSSMHFHLHHKGNVLSFHGLTQEEYDRLDGEE
jgi:hypothetical protein